MFTALGFVCIAAYYNVISSNLGGTLGFSYKFGLENYTSKNISGDIGIEIILGDEVFDSFTQSVVASANSTSTHEYNYSFSSSDLYRGIPYYIVVYTAYEKQYSDILYT